MVVQLINFNEELAKYGLTEEAYELCLADINAKQRGDMDIDWSEIRDKYSLTLSPDVIRKACSMKPFGSVFVSEYLANKNKTSVEQKYRSESSINKDGTFTSDKLIAITEDDLKNPEKLLEAHGYDVTEWELVNAKNNIWNVYSKQDGVKELYSSKITVKPIKGISLKDVSEFYNKLVSDYSSPIVKKYSEKKSGYMLEVPIQDLHYGKLSSSEIVSEEYNSKIARDCFNKIIDETIQRCSGLNIKKILFPIGNDLLHFDNVNNSTTEGTRQDSDKSHQTLFKDVVLMLIDGISKLSKELKAPVDVFCINGNHDFMSSYHALMTVWAYFNNNENVTVDTSTSPRKYRKFGKTLIGFAHGDKEKKRIAGLMPVEAADMWSDTKYREWHLGHLHSQHMNEEGGIIIRNLPSVTGTDQWHHNSGYVGAIRCCTCFLWDEENGLDCTFNVTI